MLSKINVFKIFHKLMLSKVNALSLKSICKQTKRTNGLNGLAHLCSLTDASVSIPQPPPVLLPSNPGFTFFFWLEAFHVVPHLSDCFFLVGFFRMLQPHRQKMPPCSRRLTTSTRTHPVSSTPLLPRRRSRPLH